MRRSAVVPACLLALMGFTFPAVAGQGAGNPRLSVSPATASSDRVTEIRVTGRDYLVPPHAPNVDVFGGVYVFFGWVADANRFGPSIRNSNNNDGTFGVSYVYPGNAGGASTRDDGSGALRLVSFTTGGDSGNATDFHMDDDGNWTTTIRIFGSSFTSTNPATGQTVTIDCLEVTCGVFTIGAHGKASATNEKFTPIRFSPPATTTTSSTTSSTTTTTSVTPTTNTGGQAGGPSGDNPTQGVVSTGTDDPALTTIPEGQAASTSVPLIIAQEQPGVPASTESAPVDPGQMPAIQLEVVSEESTGTLVPRLIAGLVAAGAIALAVALVRRRRRDETIETAT